MEEQNKHIDNLFKEGLGNYAETPPAGVWDALEKRLDKEQGRKPGFPPRLLWYALAVALLLLLGYFFVSNRHAANNKSALLPGNKKAAVAATPNVHPDTLAKLQDTLTDSLSSANQNSPGNPAAAVGANYHNGRLQNDAVAGAMTAPGKSIRRKNSGSVSSLSSKRKISSSASEIDNRTGNTNIAQTEGNGVKAGKKDNDGIAIIAGAPAAHVKVKRKKVTPPSVENNKQENNKGKPDVVPAVASKDKGNPVSRLTEKSPRKNQHTQKKQRTLNEANKANADNPSVDKINPAEKGITDIKADKRKSPRAVNRKPNPAVDQTNSIPVSNNKAATNRTVKKPTKAANDKNVDNSTQPTLDKKDESAGNNLSSNTTSALKKRSTKGQSIHGNLQRDDAKGVGKTAQKVDEPSFTNNEPVKKNKKPNTREAHGKAVSPNNNFYSNNSNHAKGEGNNGNDISLKQSTSSPQVLNPKVSKYKRHKPSEPLAVNGKPKSVGPKAATAKKPTIFEPVPGDYKKADVNNTTKPPLPEMKDEEVIVSHKNKPKPLPTAVKTNKTGGIDGIPVVIPGTFAEDTTDDKEDDMETPPPLNGATIVDRDRIPDYLKINTNEGSGGAGSDPASEEPKSKKKNPDWTGGIKAGYESGAAAYTARKLLFSGFVKYKMSDNISFLLQPTLKSAKANIAQGAAGSQSYYNLTNASRTLLNKTPYDTVTNIYTYRYTTNYDSIAVNNKLKNSSSLEFELPVLAEIKLSEGISLLGGVSMAYSKLMSVVQSQSTYSVSQSNVVVSPPTPPPGLPLPPDIAGLFSYKGSPYSTYVAKPVDNYQSTIRFGFMIGFSATVWDRVLIDIMMSQNITNINGPVTSDIKKVYMQPYFRLTLGYRIW